MSLFGPVRVLTKEEIEERERLMADKREQVKKNPMLPSLFEFPGQSEVERPYGWLFPRTYGIARPRFGYAFEAARIPQESSGDDVSQRPHSPGPHGKGHFHKHILFDNIENSTDREIGIYMNQFDPTVTWPPMELARPHELAFPLGLKRITLRIAWPGYAHVQYSKLNVRGMTRLQLGTAIKAEFDRFYKDHENLPCTDPKWDLRKAGRSANKLILLALRRTCQKGIWQAEVYEESSRSHRNLYPDSWRMAYPPEDGVYVGSSTSFY
ncbi:hypothetical protein EST38_g7173 [Candolleomyces aberdarensis]|uniref:Uncharacterized protein n=1 Tax=Candolleomyces aberdarensis TaxID=2316362 RepID=A0A4Q2DJ39_9AGAR|nr:hypothetical protein EST38_g7173 [Candolleomyces aberdarensis]